MHTYIHTYIHTYVCIYIHTYVYTYIHSSNLGKLVFELFQDEAPRAARNFLSLCCGDLRKVLFIYACACAWGGGGGDLRERRRWRRRFGGDGRRKSAPVPDSSGTLPRWPAGRRRPTMVTRRRPLRRSLSSRPVTAPYFAQYFAEV